MQREIIRTTAAPAAIGPYSQAVRVQNTVYCSGMLAIDPASGTLVGDTAQAQTEQIMKNITALLGSFGARCEHVVKTTIFLTDLSAFSAVNAVYGASFPSDPPARSCVEVSRLPKDALVEIEVVAVLA